MNETLHINDAPSQTVKCDSLYHNEAASYVIELRYSVQGNDTLIESKTLKRH